MSGGNSNTHCEIIKYEFGQKLARGGQMAWVVSSLVGTKNEDEKTGANENTQSDGQKGS